MLLAKQDLSLLLQGSNPLARTLTETQINPTYLILFCCSAKNSGSFAFWYIRPPACAQRGHTPAEVSCLTRELRAQIDWISSPLRSWKIALGPLGAKPLCPQQSFRKMAGSLVLQVTPLRKLVHRRIRFAVLQNARMNVWCLASTSPLRVRHVIVLDRRGD
jgi:hypothetical protein